tara:strand:- start:1811 stop:2293 length:483 start_codon:yes stop_codon:yes gene_type:complete
MNNIEIIGGTMGQQKHARSMAEYCCKMLMPRIRTLDIEIKIKSFGKDDTYGYAMPVDDHATPRFFELEINNKPRLRRLLETVAHEMVHVKQYAKGELFEVVGRKHGKHRWHGEWLSDSSKNVTEYWDQPWEIEAHGRECGLFVRWAQENNLADKQWTMDD